MKGTLIFFWRSQKNLSFILNDYLLSLRDKKIGMERTVLPFTGIEKKMGLNLLNKRKWN